MGPLDRRAALGLMGLAAAPALTGCLMEGEGPGRGGVGAGAPTEIFLDWATYNPLSLIIRDKGWMEAVGREHGQTVEWVFSAGSNKANESLRGGVIDVGSTAGSAALLARANRTPIRLIDLYSRPDWAALVRTADSPLRSVRELKGRSVAATKGTDPYFFLLQALQQEGLSAQDVTVTNLQHADGRTAMETGQVDAWSGLDPIMAAAEQDGSVIFHQDLSLNTWGFLNARERFLEVNPQGAQLVVDVYAYARDWALRHPQEGIGILAREAGIERGTAEIVWRRTHLDIDHVPGPAQREVLERVGPILVASGDVESQSAVDAAIDSIARDDLARRASAARVAPIIEGARA